MNDSVRGVKKSRLLSILKRSTCLVRYCNSANNTFRKRTIRVLELPRQKRQNFQTKIWLDFRHFDMVTISFSHSLSLSSHFFCITIFLCNTLVLTLFFFFSLSLSLCLVLSVSLKLSLYLFLSLFFCSLSIHPSFINYHHEINDITFNYWCRKIFHHFVTLIDLYCIYAHAISML